ncbi:hypothetical protein NPIL_75251 [Nephila pilipes]|uniref:Uncharacterized protein n=1 Tax=Nephila pilipes TaxID=299642 RepID=A0A8X6IDK9_NEPPI|nr:hypothetical protein NPIL_75251 [Nephila pilipes]
MSTDCFIRVIKDTEMQQATRRTAMRDLKYVHLYDIKFEAAGYALRTINVLGYQGYAADVTHLCKLGTRLITA